MGKEEQKKDILDLINALNEAYANGVKEASFDVTNGDDAKVSDITST